MLDTTKKITAVTYNGNNWPVGGNHDVDVGFNYIYEPGWVLDETSPYYTTGTGQICYLDYRSFEKSYADPCYCAYYYCDGGYTGPILVGKTQRSVQFNCGSHVESGTQFTYNGETWWRSSTGYWMRGNITKRSGFAQKLSDSAVTHEAAREMLAVYGATYSEYVPRNIERNLNGWDSSRMYYSTWSNVYNNGVNTFTFTGGSGFEDLHLTVTDLEENAHYLVKFKFCSPTGFTTAYSDYAMRLRSNGGSTILFDSTASDVPKEYWLTFFPSGTSATLQIEFGGITDGVQCTFIFSDFKLLKFSELTEN